MADTLRSNVNHAIDHVTEGAQTAANRLVDLGDTVIQQAKSKSKVVAEKATAGCESAKQSLETFQSDARDLVRKYPIAAVVAGFGLGWLVSRQLRDS
jgi:hypothetical protein